MDREKLNRANVIDAEICQCYDIINRLETCDSVTFKEGDRNNGSAYKNTSTTGGLFDVIVSAAMQYIIGRKAQLEDEFEKL